ncbi:MAG: hypothetical protein NC331_13605 [Lachnospiraceae bacterium]|nr:hypothetical protein [Lachnospiraceae bacterium]MCM1240401.1 hypothetical protein [Lachnospiraceae bacterium]
MKREAISQGISDISDCYIQEAADYPGVGKRTGWFGKAFIRNMSAAVLVLTVLVSGIFYLQTFRNDMITVYAYETDEEITSAGAVLHTGYINGNGAMQEQPLMFYLIGKDIATVRFSCKNQKLYFTDWTEKRDEYGNAQNFTVTYGEDENEYYYLTIGWFPDTAIRELKDHEDSRIAALPEELREDLIVMEISFGNGETVTKAIAISLQEDGTFLAVLEDYRIGDNDTFIQRPDSAALKDIPYEEGSPLNPGFDMDAMQAKWPGTTLTEEQIEEAEQAALAWYEGTVFSVNRIEYFEGRLPYGEETASDCNFIVNVSKGGVVQEPDRTISLRLGEDGWRVVNEGY